jgi:hypothetical protein
MSSVMGSRYRYDMEKWSAFIEVYDHLNEVYLAALKKVINETLGHDLPQCEGCYRYMIPRRGWLKLGLEDRSNLLGIVRAGSKGHCNTCYSRKIRNGELQPKAKEIPHPLPEAEAERLRRLVGI